MPFGKIALLPIFVINQLTNYIKVFNLPKSTHTNELELWTLMANNGNTNKSTETIPGNQSYEHWWSGRTGSVFERNYILNLVFRVWCSFFDEDACLWKQCTTDVDLKYFCTSKQGSDGNLNAVRKALASIFMLLVTSYT